MKIIPYKMQQKEEKAKEHHYYILCNNGKTTCWKTHQLGLMVPQYGIKDKEFKLALGASLLVHNHDITQ